MSRSTDTDSICASDAEDTLYVYHWREQQEAAMRADKGTGMTQEQVINFVNGCECSPHCTGIARRSADLILQTILVMSCTRTYCGMVYLEGRKGSSYGLS